MKIVFADRAWEDYLHWQSDPKTLLKVNALIKEQGLNKALQTWRQVV